MSHTESPSCVDITRVFHACYCTAFTYISKLLKSVFSSFLLCAPPENSVHFLSFCGWLMNWKESGIAWSWTNQGVILSFVLRAREKMREMSANIGIFLAIFKLVTLRIQTSRVTAAVTFSDVQCYSKCSFSAVTAAVTCLVVTKLIAKKGHLKFQFAPRRERSSSVRTSHC